MLTVLIGGRKEWRRIGVVALIIFLGIVMLTPLSASWRHIAAVSGRKVHPVYRVDTDEKKVALSFDACWGAERTPALLETLRRNNIRTTFFLVNIWVKQYPEQARQIVAEGHELGLHSVTHPHFTELSDDQIIKELTENAGLIKETTGFDAKLFRPPYGDYNDRVISLVQQQGFIPIQWSIDSLDWKDLSAQSMYQRIVERIEPGSIILFHNNGLHTVETLDPLIAFLKEQGYQIVPVSELVYHDNYFVDINGIQKRSR